MAKLHSNLTANVHALIKNDLRLLRYEAISVDLNKDGPIRFHCL